MMCYSFLATTIIDSCTPSHHRPIVISFRRADSNLIHRHKNTLRIFTNTHHTMSPRSVSVLAVLMALVSTTHAFAPVSQIPSANVQTTTSLNIFGNALKDAFGNDDTLGARKNEGLSGGPDYNENVSVNGKKVPGAVVGQKLTVVAGRARVKIPVNCQKGDCGRLAFAERRDLAGFLFFHCALTPLFFFFLHYSTGTCMVNLNGRKVKACQTPLPKGKANIQTL